MITCFHDHPYFHGLTWNWWNAEIQCLSKFGTKIPHFLYRATKWFSSISETELYNYSLYLSIFQVLSWAECSYSDSYICHFGNQLKTKAGSKEEYAVQLNFLSGRKEGSLAEFHRGKMKKQLTQCYKENRRSEYRGLAPAFWMCFFSTY